MFCSLHSLANKPPGKCMLRVNCRRINILLAQLFCLSKFGDSNKLEFADVFMKECQSFENGCDKVMHCAKYELNVCRYFMYNKLHNR